MVEAPPEQEEAEEGVGEEGGESGEDGEAFRFSLFSPTAFFFSSIMTTCPHVLTKTLSN